MARRRFVPLFTALQCQAVQVQKGRMVGRNIERLLNDGARAFVNHPRGVRFEGDRLVVSSLYVWYQADFGGDAAGVLAHLRKFADPPLAERLAGWQGGFDDQYDWRLNAP